MPPHGEKRTRVAYCGKFIRKRGMKRIFDPSTAEAAFLFSKMQRFWGTLAVEQGSARMRIHIPLMGARAVQV